MDICKDFYNLSAAKSVQVTVDGVVAFEDTVPVSKSWDFTVSIAGIEKAEE